MDPVAAHLSHLFLPLVHRLSVLRAGHRRALSQTTETQATALLLLFVQDLVLRKQQVRMRIKAFPVEDENPCKQTVFLLTHQPSSGDDESVSAGLAEERLSRGLSFPTEAGGLVPPVGLTDPQLLTGDAQTEKVRQHRKRSKSQLASAAVQHI